MTTPRECCSPHHGVYFAGLCIVCQKPEEGSDHIRGRWDRPAPVASDSVAHFTRTDPGRSLPGDCVHSFHRAGRCALGRFRCSHCGLVLIATDP